MYADVVEVRYANKTVETMPRLRGDKGAHRIDYLRVLHLAASTGEHAVEQALAGLLERGEASDYVAVKALAHPVEPSVPMIHIGVPDLRRYDALLAAGGES